MSFLGFKIFKILISPFYKKGLGRYKILAKIHKYLFDYSKPKGIIPISIQTGHKLYIDSSDISLTPTLLMSGGVWEPGITALLGKIISSGMTVIDVGANIGYHTLTAADLVGSGGKVYAFEPEPGNFDLLNKNIHANKYDNVTTICKAVADKVGISKMIVYPTRHGANKLVAPNSIYKTTIPVEVVTLDEFFKDVRRSINIIKVDVEGFEPAVFNGMQDIIKQNPDIKLLLEFYPKGIHQCGYSPKDFLTNIEHHGFKIFHINEVSGQLIIYKNIDELLSNTHSKTYFNILCSRSAIN